MLIQIQGSFENATLIKYHYYLYSLSRFQYGFHICNEDRIVCIWVIIR